MNYVHIDAKTAVLAARLKWIAIVKVEEEDFHLFSKNLVIGSNLDCTTKLKMAFCSCSRKYLAKTIEAVGKNSANVSTAWIRTLC